MAFPSLFVYIYVLACKVRLSLNIQCFLFVLQAHASDPIYPLFEAILVHIEQNINVVNKVSVTPCVPVQLLRRILYPSNELFKNIHCVFD
jgi:hypothetical protein